MGDSLALRVVLLAGALGVLGIAATLAFPPWVALAKSNGQWQEVDRVHFRFVGRTPAHASGVMWTIDPVRYRRRLAVSLVLALAAPSAALIGVRGLTSPARTTRSDSRDEP